MERNASGGPGTGSESARMQEEVGEMGELGER